jgi:tungstate transport system substrate-binding protein
LRFRKRVELAVLCEGDARLLNHYGVTVMKGPRQQAAETFADWVTSSETQQLIGDFGRKDFGRSLFTPDGPGS